MPTYAMGSAIREMRRRLGYTQEELAFGICTAGTLSKIENGKAIASKRVFEALCSRIPEIHHVWISCDTKAEMERSKLCKMVLLYLELRKMEEAKAAMMRYGQLKETDNPFCAQFLLYTQAIYQGILREHENQVLPKLNRALAITMPDFQKRIYARKTAVLFTYDELYILSNIGIAYVRKGDMGTAHRIFAFLKEYVMWQDFDLPEYMKVYPMILGNLAWVLEQQGQFREAVKPCEDGIEICFSAGNYTILPYLLCIQARCLTASGNPTDARKCRAKAEAILGMRSEKRIYGSFEEFYKADEPIYVVF